MRKFFYARLAADNLKKNRQTYLPYLISGSITCAMLYVICSLSMNDGLTKMAKGRDSAPVILRIGTFLAMFFAAIFLFYTNSFLMKHRRKEFGLYQLLGMEKRHLARVLLGETFFSLMITVLTGFTAGILLDKLMFLLLLRIMGGMSAAEIPFGFHICGRAMLYVGAFFGIVFFLILLNAVRIVHFTKPVTMLSEANAGEREPKTKLVMTILGVLLLGTGYTMSILAKNTDLILKLMLPAVLSVIAGTYLLFTAGSIALLKLLKRNKFYYYKTRHFTSVSGMIYRMKQNAVGLGSICILSTMVLVMVSSTTCMMLGMNDLLAQMYPREAVFSLFCSADKEPEFIEKINAYMAENNVTPENPVSYTKFTMPCLFMDGKVVGFDYYDSSIGVQNRMLTVISSDFYTRMTGTDIPLEKNEILLACGETLPSLRQQTEICGIPFRIRKLTEPIYGYNDQPMNILAVVSDTDVLKQIAGSETDDLRYTYAFDMPAEREEELFGDMDTRWKDEQLSERLGHAEVDLRSEMKTVYLSIFGGFFFIALFLGVLFTLQMVLMIYYKQISEGHDDRQRYVIMQNVGMSLGEVKQTIRSQILTVFFLPLVLAAIHTAFCIPVITRVLSQMELINLKLIYLILAGTFLCFSLLYVLIYALTAKIYYRIVSTKTAET